MQLTDIEPAGIAGRSGHGDAWARIPTVALDPRHLARNRIVAFGRHDPAHVAFDLLRTRLLQVLRAQGWSRVGVTSPTRACGKTFVATNLALSLARRPSCRTVLLDLDLRIPSIARVLGLSGPGRMTDLLAGRVPLEAALRRIGENAAVGPGGAPFDASAELIQEPSTAAALDRLRAELAPDVVLCDLPPALACDDVIALLPQLDGVLLVTAGGTTTADEVRACERLIAGQAPLLGVVLNKADDAKLEPYYA